MLVLSRKKHESIQIGDSIMVTVVEVRGGKVRLGINAPGELPIHRSEIAEAIGHSPTPQPDPPEPAFG